MALEGTLRDFTLADIFQLIGLQRKTGVLTLSGSQDTVSVPFEQGRIVGADSEQKHIEDRLGHVLLKTGKLRPEQLDRVLRLQRETGRRIGDLLVGENILTREDLARALQLQVTQILYRLFRWSDGEFRFAQAASVEYDRRCFRPIPVENILMEGLRILDEWPLIERRVRSFSLVYGPTDPSRIVREEGQGDSGEALEDSLDSFLGLESSGAEASARPARAASGPDLVTVSAQELVAYRLADGLRSVQDIIDRSDLGEFETCKALYALLEKELIQEVVPEQERPSVRGRGLRAVLDRGLATLVALGASGVVVAGGWLAFQDPGARLLAPYPVPQLSETLRLSASQARLARLEFAVRLYGLYRGRYPESLNDLATMGLVTESELRDPWGKSYTYLLSRRSYQIRGLDGQGQARPDLILTGQIPPVSRPEAPAGRLSRR